MAIGKPAAPMEFESFDKRPVRMIVLLASPPDKTSDHIQALGKVSRLMANPTFRNKAYETASAEALHQLFREAEGG
jgi:mannitol/fructose-specific phosphotransferase system IIA component (Ntr-type)